MLWSFLERRIRRMAYPLAVRFNVDVEDLVQWGWIGVLQAYRRYQPDRGPFWPFARHYVRAAMQEGILGRHLSDRARRAMPRVREAVAILSQAGISDPSPEDIARVSGVPRAVVEEILRACRAQQPLPREEPEEGRGNRFPEALIAPSPDEDVLRREEVEERVRWLIRHLGHREACMYLALCLLRGEEGCGAHPQVPWEEVAQRLSHPEHPPPPWPELWDLYPGVCRVLPELANWAWVCGLFPHRTAGALRQRFSRLRRQVKSLIAGKGEV
ncbi:sigma-70 family RNA polymerase sigma factor [Thermoflexus hugenholtzii]